jgi:hypothetical protein
VPFLVFSPTHSTFFLLPPLVDPVLPSIRPPPLAIPFLHPPPLVEAPAESGKASSSNRILTFSSAGWRHSIVLFNKQKYRALSQTRIDWHSLKRHRPALFGVTTETAEEKRERQARKRAKVKEESSGDEFDSDSDSEGQ